MRQSRAPTASQIQNPPPPSSSTKSGRFFGKGKFSEFYPEINLSASYHLKDGNALHNWTCPPLSVEMWLVHKQHVIVT